MGPGFLVVLIIASERKRISVGFPFFHLDFFFLTFCLGMTGEVIFNTYVFKCSFNEPVITQLTKQDWSVCK